MAKSYKPTEAVASNAAKGLEMRQRVKGGTDVGVARARDLSNRKPVSLDTIGRMVSYFARHGAQRPDDEGTEANPTPWLVAWMLWGGDAGRRWANGIWKRDGKQGMARGEHRAQAREFARREVPESCAIINPKGLRQGEPFRTFTADEPVRSEADGSLLGLLSADDLAEMVRVFYAQAGLQEGAPRINYNHGPSRGGLPDIYGEAIGLFVEDDGERGPGLYVVPGWTDYGAEFVDRHKTPDGGSVLSNSPEFIVGDVYARGGGTSEQGERIGSAAFLGVALTPTPQQQERIIDPVRLSRGSTTEPPAGRESGMDAEKRPDDGGKADDGSRMDTLERAFAEMVARLDSIAEAVGEMKAEAKDDMSKAEPDGMAAEPEGLALSVQRAEDGLTAEQRVELSRRITPEDARALAGDGDRVLALSRRLALVSAIKAEGKVAELSRKVETLTSERTAAKVELARQELRAMGGSADRVERIVGMLSRKLAQPEAWATVHGDACPYEAAVADLKARPDVELAVRSGVSAEPVKIQEHTMATIAAWARESGVDGGPLKQAQAYAKAHNISVEEVQA